MTEHDYREQDLKDAAYDRSLRFLTALIDRYHSNGRVYAQFIMDNYDYGAKTVNQILAIMDDLEICEQCGEVTEKEYMCQAELPERLCEWCQGNGQ
jgi:hypothetical protein